MTAPCSAASHRPLTPAEPAFEVGARAAGDDGRRGGQRPRELSEQLHQLGAAASRPAGAWRSRRACRRSRAAAGGSAASAKALAARIGREHRRAAPRRVLCALAAASRRFATKRSPHAKTLLCVTLRWSAAMRSRRSDSGSASARATLSRRALLVVRVDENRLAHLGRRARELAQHEHARAVALAGDVLLGDEVQAVAQRA